jgi:hypothetical protein
VSISELEKWPLGAQNQLITTQCGVCPYRGSFVRAFVQLHSVVVRAMRSLVRMLLIAIVQYLFVHSFVRSFVRLCSKMKLEMSVTTVDI